MTTSPKLHPMHKGVNVVGSSVEVDMPIGYFKKNSLKRIITARSCNMTHAQNDEAIQNQEATKANGLLMGVWRHWSRWK